MRSSKRRKPSSSSSLLIHGGVYQVQEHLPCFIRDFILSKKRLNSVLSICTEIFLLNKLVVQSTLPSFNTRTSKTSLKKFKKKWMISQVCKLKYVAHILYFPFLLFRIVSFVSKCNPSLKRLNNYNCIVTIIRIVYLTKGDGLSHNWVEIFSVFSLSSFQFC